MNPTVINIVSVSLIGKYQLRLGFDDGKVQDIDFCPFLNRSQHPAVRAYLDEARFNSYRLEFGELIWGDYDLCFPVIDLYNNQIEHHAPLRSVA